MFAHVLEEHGLEWRKEWHGSGGSAPHNGITKACYRGSNAFLLSLIAMSKGYDDPRWVTMVQIMDKDGKYHPKEKWHLKAGSKAAYVEYWYPYDLKQKKALTWEQFRREKETGRSDNEFRLSTRYTAVFNACDVEGIPLRTEPDISPADQDALLVKLCVGMDVELRFDGGDRAYYAPQTDEVHLPTPASFNDAYAFHATVLHELAHATGHPSRLNRPMNGFFGSADYAYEELVAEMSACFMGAQLAVAPTPQHIDNHKAYVQSWVRAVRDQPDTLIRAIRDAQSVSAYMDWKAGLISDPEYAAHCRSTMELPSRRKERDAR
jgi:antirestriction protein ArdC